MSRTRLPELHRALVAAAAALDAAQTQSTAPPSRRRRRRLPTTRVLLVALVVMLAIAAIAVAATGLLQQGSDVPPPSGQAPRPTKALGVVSGATPAPITAADPRGGLDWGLRSFHTTRGFACVQVGRVQAGALGLVGADGAFQDDGRFHPLGPQVLERGNCTPVDGAGHGFLALHYAAYPGSGFLAGCLDPWWAAHMPATMRDGKRACPARDLRTLDFGMLGPRAVSVTYTLPSGERRVAPVQRGTGAFLVVTPYVPPAPPPPGDRLAAHSVPSQDFIVGRSPAANTIVEVRYDDGTVCHVRHVVRGSAGGCPTVGEVPLHVRQPSHAAVATPIRLSITREADGRHRDLHVAFRARVAALGSRAAYWIFIRPPRHTGCHDFGEGHQIDRDVAAGQRVGAKIRLIDGGCPGTWAVELSYRIAVQRPGFAGASNLHYPGTLVAADSVTTR